MVSLYYHVTVRKLHAYVRIPLKVAQVKWQPLSSLWQEIGNLHDNVTFLPRPEFKALISFVFAFDNQRVSDNKIRESRNGKLTSTYRGLGCVVFTYLRENCTKQQRYDAVRTFI